MFSTLSGKKAIADDIENRNRCTIYESRKRLVGIFREVVIVVRNHRRKADCNLWNKKKNIQNTFHQQEDLGYFIIEKMVLRNQKVY